MFWFRFKFRVQIHGWVIVFTMPAFKDFEEIESWQLSRTLARNLYDVYQTTDLKNDFKLWNQINGSSGSIMDNIAEGFERGSNREFVQFLFIAKGSSGELRSQLYRLIDRGYVDQGSFDSYYSDLIEIRKKINGLIRYLKDSEHKGYKFKETENDYGMEE